MTKVYKKRPHKYHLILSTITNTLYGYNVERVPEYFPDDDPTKLFYFGDFVIKPEYELKNKSNIYVYPAKVLRDLIGEYTINVLDTSTVIPRYTSICTFNGENIQVSLLLPMHTQVIENCGKEIKLQIRDARFTTKLLTSYEGYLRRIQWR